MSGHTPGPWILGTHPANQSLHVVSPVMFGGMVTVLPECEGGHVSINKIEDARLISASPELLEACRFVVQFLDSLEDPIDDPALTKLRRRVHAPLRAHLNPAIAKAEGRS